MWGLAEETFFLLDLGSTIAPLPCERNLARATLKQSMVLSTVLKSQAKQSAWGLKYKPLAVERAADERD